jgi:hypothetical protein
MTMQTRISGDQTAIKGCAVAVPGVADFCRLDQELICHG